MPLSLQRVNFQPMFSQIRPAVAMQRLGVCKELLLRTLMP